MERNNFLFILRFCKWRKNAAVSRYRQTSLSCVLSMVMLSEEMLIWPVWTNHSLISVLSQLQLICNFAGNVLKGNGCTRYPLEAHTIQWEAGKLAHLHFPLDQALLPCIAMDTEKEEALTLLIVAVVDIQHLTDLTHHVPRLHGRGGLHAPGKAQRAGLGVTALLFGLSWSTPAQSQGQGNEEHPGQLATQMEKSHHSQNESYVNESSLYMTYSFISRDGFVLDFIWTDTNTRPA